jgi:hypothetical protein
MISIRYALLWSSRTNEEDITGRYKATGGCFADS